MQGLSLEGNKIVTAIKMELAKQLEQQRIAFLTIVEEKTREVDGLRTEVRELRDIVVKLEEKVDDGDAYERRDTLIFSGDGVPAVAAEESCRDIICSLVTNKLHLVMRPADISTAHRLGRKPLSQLPDRRKIAVKLCRRDLKRDILYACRQEKPDLYVNESLTPSRNTIMYVIRKMKKEHPHQVMGCSSIDGRVFGWVKPPAHGPPGLRNVKILVNTHAALQEFCTNFVNRPLTDFIDMWPH
jgi:hypothetical protein